MNEFIRSKSVELAEQFFRFIFFWEKDDTRIGHLIRWIHHAVMYCILVMIIVTHTLLPESFVLLLSVYICVVLIWIQHIVTGGCLVSKVEQKLLKDTNSFVDPFLELFHIPITPESTVGVTIMGSTLVVVMLELEVFARGSIAVHEFINNVILK